MNEKIKIDAGCNHNFFKFGIGSKFLSNWDKKGNIPDEILDSLDDQYIQVGCSYCGEIRRIVQNGNIEILDKKNKIWKSQ